MSQQQPTKFPEPKIIRRLSQWAVDPASSARERANMTYAIKGPNLEVLVWTRGDNDKGKGPIRANMSLLQVHSLCTMLENVAAAPGKHVEELPINYPEKADPNNREAKREIVEQALVRVVKNTDGVVSIGVFDKKDDTRSRILFPYTLDRFTGLIKINGEPLGEDGTSCMVARSYARILRSEIDKVAEVTTDEQNRSAYGDRSNSFKKPAPQRSQGLSNNDSGLSDITY